MVHIYIFEISAVTSFSKWKGEALAASHKIKIIQFIFPPQWADSSQGSPNVVVTRRTRNGSQKSALRVPDMAINSFDGHFPLLQTPRPLPALLNPHVPLHSLHLPRVPAGLLLRPLLRLLPSSTQTPRSSPPPRLLPPLLLVSWFPPPSRRFFHAHALRRRRRRLRVPVRRVRLLAWGLWWSWVVLEGGV